MYIHIIYTGQGGLARLRDLANPRAKEARVNHTCIFHMYHGWVLPTFRVLPSRPLHMYVYTLLTRSNPTCILYISRVPRMGSPHISCLAIPSALHGRVNPPNIGCWCLESSLTVLYICMYGLSRFFYVGSTQVDKFK